MHQRPASPLFGPFAAGAALAVIFGVLAWIAFLLLTMMMDPALTGADYWLAVLDRAKTNQVLSGAFGIFCLGVVYGVFLMSVSAVRRYRRAASVR